MADVWPVAFAQPLPPVPVPLLPGDADVTLDLQQALSAVYDGFGYTAVLDYTRPPAAPLDPPHAAWAREQLNIPRAGAPR